MSQYHPVSVPSATASWAHSRCSEHDSRGTHGHMAISNMQLRGVQLSPSSHVERRNDSPNICTIVIHLEIEMCFPKLPTVSGVKEVAFL